MKTIMMVLGLGFALSSFAIAETQILTKIQGNDVWVTLYENMGDSSDQAPNSRLMEYYNSIPARAIDLPIGGSMKNFGMDSGAFTFEGIAQFFGPVNHVKCDFRFSQRNDREMAIKVSSDQKEFFVTFRGKRAKELSRFFNAGVKTLPFRFDSKGSLFEGITNENAEITFHGIVAE